MFWGIFFIYCQFIFSLLGLTQQIKGFKFNKKPVKPGFALQTAQVLGSPPSPCALLALGASIALSQCKSLCRAAGKVGFPWETQIWRTLGPSGSDNSELFLEFCLLGVFSLGRSTSNKYDCSTTHRTPTLLQTHKESSSLLWGIQFARHRRQRERAAQAQRMRGSAWSQELSACRQANTAQAETIPALNLQITFKNRRVPAAKVVTKKMNLWEEVSRSEKKQMLIAAACRGAVVALWMQELQPGTAQRHLCTGNF